jgi:hypothetical protein
MTAVKISDFNEPASYPIHHIKSDDETDEEEQRPNQLRESTSGSSSTNVLNKKRYNWDDFNEEDRQPTKKRYRFE